MNQPWYKTLADKIKEDPSLAQELKARIPESTFQELKAGRPRVISKMTKERRALLYKLTQIEELHFEGYESHLAAPYEKFVQEEQAQAREDKQLPQVANSHSLDVLAEKVDFLARAINTYFESNEPSVKQRVNAVRYSLRTLYDQMVYFASEKTPEKERVTLANSIDSVSFGLIWNVMDGILKDPKSPEVFARAAISQGFGRPK